MPLNNPSQMTLWFPYTDVVKQGTDRNIEINVKVPDNYNLGQTDIYVNYTTTCVLLFVNFEQDKQATQTGEKVVSCSKLLTQKPSGGKILTTVIYGDPAAGGSGEDDWNGDDN